MLSKKNDQYLKVIIKKRILAVQGRCKDALPPMVINHTYNKISMSVNVLFSKNEVTNLMNYTP